ncbi:MAG: ribonuclease P protein component [Anaerolineaceae bacterium]
MNRKFWITSTNDFKRVRLAGRSYAHPLVVIICTTGLAANSRAGIITGKAIGNAVKRNRARRRLRVILSQYLPVIKTTSDLVIIGRTSIDEANYQEIKTAVQKLLIRAGLLD